MARREMLRSLSRPRNGTEGETSCRIKSFSPSARAKEAAQASVNVLNPGHEADMGESSSVHGIEVTISPLISNL